MSVLLRARVASFLCGVAVAGVFGVYNLKHDLKSSHDLLADQVSVV